MAVMLFFYFIAPEYKKMFN